MKVVQINAVSGIRSTGRICKDLIDYLKENGHQGYMAYAFGVPYEGYKIGNKLDRKMHAFLSRLTGKQAYFSKIQTLKFINYLDKVKPDLVHLHNLHGNYINLRLLLQYLAKKNIPTVVTLHDCWFFTGKCCHYTVSGCYKWKTACCNCPRIHKDNPSWLFDCTDKMYRDKKQWFEQIHNLVVVGVSDWITKEAKQSLLNSARRITRIYNGIDMELFKPVNSENLRKKLKLDTKFILLGVSSIWSNDKGISHFLTLSDQLPEHIVIILIGNILENLDKYKKIIHIRETHNITTLVRFYSMADVFLNLSLEESFSTVTIESLSCGTPVIAFDSTSNPEQIRENCGYLVEKGRTDQILDKVREVETNGKSYYSKHCIQFVRENLKKEDRLDDYLNLYQQLIRNKVK